MILRIFFISILSALPSVTLALSPSTLPIFTGVSADDKTGYSVAANGDINNDGYDDVVIGAYQVDASGFNSGAVYIVYGTSTVFSGSTDMGTAVKLAGENNNDLAGVSVAIVGDINSDGYDDIVVGARGYNSSTGAAYLIYGQAASLSSGSLSSYARFTGEIANDYAGETVAGIGDINNDGYDDILIGARIADGETANTGAAYLIYGQSTALTSANLSTKVKFSGEDEISSAGLALAGVGDINNDSYDDFAIGAMNNTTNNLQDGALFLVYGQATMYANTNLSTVVKFHGTAGNQKLGYGMGAIGDINNDGYDDFIASARMDDLNNAGRAYVVYGRSAQYTSADISMFNAFTSVAADNYIGFTAVGLGDINVDGYDDFAISGARFTDTLSHAGRTFIIYGQAASFSNTSVTTLTTYYDGVEASDRLSEDLTAGDLNNDGFKELLMAAPNYDVTASNNEGAVYTAYLSIDGDHDGVAGTTGVLVDGTDCDDANASFNAAVTYYQDSDGDGLGSDTTTSLCAAAPVGYVANTNDTNDNDADNDGTVTASDCNDNDATLTTMMTYYQDSDGDSLGSDITTTACSLTPPTGYVANSNDNDDTDGDDVASAIELGNDLVDNDGDGLIDEVNTLAENGIHPAYGTSDRISADEYAANITSLAGAIDGGLLVTFSDGAVYLYDLFTVTSVKLTQVVAYDATGTVAVTHPRAKSIALVNAYTGEVLDRVTLSKSNFVKQSLKSLDLRSNHSLQLVVTAKRKATTKVSVLRVNLVAGTASLADQVTVHSNKIAVNKTSVKQKLLLLKNANGKILPRYQISKRYRLTAD